MEQPAATQTPPPVQKRKKHFVLAAVLLIIGFLFLAAGATLVYYNSTTSSDGFTYSNIYHVNTPSYAFTAYMNQFQGGTFSFLGEENIGQLKFKVTNLTPGKDVFIGYATTRESESYRKSFQCTIPTYWTWHVNAYDAEIDITTTIMDGAGAPPSMPQTQTFWRASDQATDTATMTALPVGEQYIWFIMNSDGSANITADIQIGFRSPILTILPLIFLPIGILLLMIGIFLLIRKKKQPINAE
jgi:hypothetical protein